MLLSSLTSSTTGLARRRPADGDETLPADREDVEGTGKILFELASFDAAAQWR
jgi:hypothetical protein